MGPVSRCLGVFLEGVRGAGYFSVKGSWLRTEAKQGCLISSVLPSCVIPELSVQLMGLSSNCLSVKRESLKIPELVGFRPGWIQALSDVLRVSLPPSALVSTVLALFSSGFSPPRWCTQPPSAPGAHAVD